MSHSEPKFSIFNPVALALAIAGGLSIFSFSAEAGGDHSGGGTVVIRSPHSSPVLLDLLEVSADLQETHLYSDASRLESSHYVEAIGVDMVSVENLPAYQQLAQRLSAWYKFAPGLVTLIRHGLASESFRETNFKLKVIPEYSLSKELIARYPALKLQSAIVFHNDHLVAHEIPFTTISIPIWNALGDQSQLGLFIHEALRYQQVEGGLSLTNAQLQSITAKLVLNEPSVSVDFSSDLNGTFKAVVAKIDTYVEKNSQLLPQICIALKAIESRFPLSTDMITKKPISMDVDAVCEKLGDARSFTLDAFTEISSALLVYDAVDPITDPKDLQLFTHLYELAKEWTANQSALLNDAELANMRILEWEALYKGAKTASTDDVKWFRMWVDGQENSVPPAERERIRAQVLGTEIYIQSLKRSGVLVDASSI